jgi:uncharacterized protein (TIGR03083 family)
MMNVVELDRRAAAGTAGLIDATSRDQYEAPTPCADWTVHDLLAHLIAGNLKYIEIAGGKDWARGAPDVVLDDDPRRDVSPHGGGDAASVGAARRSRSGDPAARRSRAR